jgi:hypothetical protein
MAMGESSRRTHGRSTGRVIANCLDDIKTIQIQEHPTLMVRHVSIKTAQTAHKTSASSSHFESIQIMKE